MLQHICSLAAVQQPKKFHNFAYVAFWQHIALLLHAALGIAIT